MHILVEAIQRKDLPVLVALLADDPSLAKKDLRPANDQDDFSNGFALYQAAQVGSEEIIRLLLKHGADPNATGRNADNQPEFGQPLCMTVEQERYANAHLLLDYGASVFAYPYCAKPMIELLYEQARKAGVEQSTIRKGFESYLQEHSLPAIDADAPEAIRLYYRVLAEGGQPNISPIVRDEYNDLIADLLKTCPLDSCPRLSYPQGTIFDNIIDRASWYGYPQIVQMCRKHCPQIYTPQHARSNIYRALVSHNRDGTINDFVNIVEHDLEFLRASDALDDLKSAEPLYPFHLIAEHFAWHNNYGYKAPPLIGTDIIRMAQVFLDHGFDDFGAKHPKDKVTAIEKARARLHHPGVPQYIEFLERLG